MSKSETRPLTAREKIEIRLMPAAQLIAKQAAAIDVEEACRILKTLIANAKGDSNASQ